MKTIAKRLTMMCVLCLLFFTSCETETTETQAINFSEADATRASEADNAIDGALNIMQQVFEENIGLSKNSSSSLFPECATITIVVNGDSGVITLDFGADCQLNNGSVVSGKIILEYGTFIGGTRTINYAFENFYYNDNGIEGGGVDLWQIANDNGNPQSTIDETITVSFPNTDVTATRVGYRVAEWVEGVGSGTWTDNIYHITGNWNTTFTNGFEREGLITDKLVCKLSCNYLVSGTVEIIQEGFTGILDFGEGNCDNVVTLTINGQEIIIYL